MSVSDEQWRKDALGIPGELRAVPRSEDDDGLREAMLVVWARLAMASTTIKHLYSPSTWECTTCTCATA